MIPDNPMRVAGPDELWSDCPVRDAYDVEPITLPPAVVRPLDIPSYRPAPYYAAWRVLNADKIRERWLAIGGLVLEDIERFARCQYDVYGVNS